MEGWEQGFGSPSLPESGRIGGANLGVVPFHPLLTQIGKDKMGMQD